MTANPRVADQGELLRNELRHLLPVRRQIVRAVRQVVVRTGIPSPRHAAVAAVIHGGDHFGATEVVVPPVGRNSVLANDHRNGPVGTGDELEMPGPRPQRSG